MMNNKKTGNIKKLSIKKLYGGKLKEDKIPKKKDKIKVIFFFFNINFNLFFYKFFRIKFSFLTIFL